MPISRNILFLCCGLFVPAGAFAGQDHPIPARESLDLFRLPPNVRIELVAAEPEVIDPVALAFDARGRMYVVEMRNYPEDTNGDGIIALLEDMDHDGYFEKRTVFADGFDFPNGVMPWKAGVLVTCAPNLYFLKDTDGDGRADSREAVLQGFALGGSTQLRVSHPMLGMDNWIYLTNGLSGGEITTPAHPDRPAVKMGSLDGRYHPLTGAFETTAGQAQFGQAFDALGNKFVCSNRKHIEHVVLQLEDLARNPYLDFSQTVAEIPDHGAAARIYAISEARTTAYAHAGTFTAACGLVIYLGDALPPDYYGDGFVCDPTANIVHRDQLEPKGPTFAAVRAEHDREFLATTDNWCRPVFLANGPDGALYLCDMYRKTIEHPTYLPEEIRAVTDFEAGKDRGRIYRIVSADSASRTSFFENVALFEGASSQTLCKALGHANGWVADTAQRLILEKLSSDDAPLLREAALRIENPSTQRIRALYLLDELKQADEQLIVGLSADPVAPMREHALRIARRSRIEKSALLHRNSDWSSDSEPRVRFVAALALGEIESDSATELLGAILERDFEDPWIRAAVLSSSKGRAGALAERMLASPNDSGAYSVLMASLGRMVALAEPAERTMHFVTALLEIEPGEMSDWKLASLRGICEGVHRNKAFGDGVPAFEWLLTALPMHGVEQADRLGAVLDQAARIAGDASLPVSKRKHAVELLGYCGYDRAGDVLGGLLTAQTHPELQSAAVRSLTLTGDNRIAQLFTADGVWGALPQTVRSAAASALLVNVERAKVLLDSIERGDVEPWTIEPSARSRLQNFSDDAIRKRADAAFAAVKPENRKEVFEQYKDALALTPDPASGAAVFKELCSSCHSFQGIGFQVGPDLTDIKSQPNESILMHILMPNWLLVEGFENVVIETAEFETYSGIIVAQNESSVTIRCAYGVEKTVPRTDIANLRAIGASLMPEELEKGMTKQQMRDLIGYLKGEGAPRQ